MKMATPSMAAPGLHQIRVLGSRVTVLFDGEDVVLVDCGARGSLPWIAAGLKRLGSSLDRVRLVVITHTHPDHCGSLGKLVDATNAWVAVHKEEAPFVNGDAPMPNPFRVPLMAALARPILPRLYDHPVRVHYVLDDGDALPVRQPVRVIHTPGHTRGSLSLYVAGQQAIIVGDALQFRFRRLSPPAWAVTQDHHLARESLGKLLELDFQTLCFSHFPPLRLEARESLARLVGKIEKRKGGA